MKFTTYLNFDGKCAEAFQFYAGLFGGEITYMQTFRESPMANQVDDASKDFVLHATLKLGDDTLMGSDAPPPRYQTPAGFSVTFATSDLARAEHVFAALSEDGTVTLPLQETFWAPRFGMVTDRFGTPWMINGETPA